MREYQIVSSESAVFERANERNKQLRRKTGTTQLLHKSEKLSEFEVRGQVALEGPWRKERQLIQAQGKAG